MSKEWGVFLAKHIIPLEDAREHIISDKCWCNPTADPKYENNLIILHHSVDKREKYEHLKVV